jgi:hypothetical protein
MTVETSTGCTAQGGRAEVNESLSENLNVISSSVLGTTNQLLSCTVIDDRHQR